MARTFHRRKSLSTVSEINVTPLIDLAFALLIIFMITAPLLEQSIDLQLPREQAKAQNPPEDRPVANIAIDPNGQFYWNNQALSGEALRQRLAEAAGAEEVPIIELRADASLPYQQVVTVVDWIKQAGLVDLSLQTQAD